MSSCGWLHIATDRDNLGHGIKITASLEMHYLLMHMYMCVCVGGCGSGNSPEEGKSIFAAAPSL